MFMKHMNVLQSSLSTSLFIYMYLYILHTVSLFLVPVYLKRCQQLNFHATYVATFAERKTDRTEKDRQDMINNVPNFLSSCRGLKIHFTGWLNT